MDAFWRAKTAVLSAAKGWSCVWLCLLTLWTFGSLRAGAHVPVLDQLSMYLIYGIATGIVTVGATVLLIVPYVCLRGVNALRQRPWLIYVESGAITIFASVVLTHFVKPTAETFLHTFYPYVVFALATSIASSAFYMSKVKAISAQLTTVD